MRPFAPFSVRLAIAAVVLLVASLSIAAPLEAGSGGVQQLPMPGVKLKNALRLQVDTRWVDANGYRPVRIKATPFPPGPAPADRQIRVEIRPYDYSSSAGQNRFSKIIDIPEGSTSVEAILPVPQESMWYAITLNVFEGGDKLEDLSVEMLSLPRTHYWNWTEASPCVLLIDSDLPDQAARDALVTAYKSTGTDKNPTFNLPDLRNFMRIFPENQYAGQMVAVDESKKSSDAVMLSQMAETSRAEMLAPSELPEKWLELSAFDATFISLGDLAAMKEKHPRQFRALRDWLATGTVLIVYDVGTEFERLNNLEQLLAIPPLASAAGAKGDNAKSDAKYRGWTPADPKQHTADLSGYDVNVQSQPYLYGAGRQAMRTTPALPAVSLKAPPSPPFVSRTAGLGYVFAIAAEQPFPGERNDWVWLLNSVPNDRWMWYKRHGFSMHRTNDDFWNLLIPGVGMAPVMSFLLLISLFAVLIGPVNYLVLGRAQRLYLLLVTVPAGAAMVTVALFLYAITTDGLGVRLRTRSFTDIDQRSGQVASWSRQSYYASIAPSRGLHYPEDTAVYPIVHQPISRTGQRSTPLRVVDWDEDGQQLRRGYLYSRSAAQFLAVRAGQTESHLKVSTTNPPKVDNHLGAMIQYLLLRSTDGSYFQAKNVAVESSATLSPAAFQGAQRQLGSLASATVPKYPEGYDPSMHENLVTWMMPNLGRWNNVDGGASIPTMSTGVLETNLSLLSYPRGDPLEPGTYLAVVDTPPDVPLGVTGAREKMSLHVIRGRW